MGWSSVLWNRSSAFRMCGRTAAGDPPTRKGRRKNSESGKVGAALAERRRREETMEDAGAREEGGLFWESDKNWTDTFTFTFTRTGLTRLLTRLHVYRKTRIFPIGVPRRKITWSNNVEPRRPRLCAGDDIAMRSSFRSGSTLKNRGGRFPRKQIMKPGLTPRREEGLLGEVTRTGLTRLQELD